MATWMKRRSAASPKEQSSREVREAVEAALSNIGERGDAAIREMSIRYESVDRDDYRLTPPRFRIALIGYQTKISGISNSLRPKFAISRRFKKRRSLTLRLRPACACSSNGDDATRP